MAFIKKILQKYFPELYAKVSLMREIKRTYKKESYSQFGEDAILQKIITKKNGFYIDIGAYHPIKFSNTYAFYKKGWRGINIDALPGSMESFKKIRPLDINLEIGIDTQTHTIPFYTFQEQAFNTFSKEAYEKYISQLIPFARTIEIETAPLAKVLESHVTKKQHIDFMSIDVEGLDLKVLQSNDWNKYRPDYILVEIHSHSIESVHDSEVYNYLVKQGYALIALSVITFIFKHESIA